MYPLEGEKCMPLRTHHDKLLILKKTCVSCSYQKQIFPKIDPQRASNFDPATSSTALHIWVTTTQHVQPFGVLGACLKTKPYHHFMLICSSTAKATTIKFYIIYQQKLSMGKKFPLLSSHILYPLHLEDTFFPHSLHQFHCYHYLYPSSHHSAILCKFTYNQDMVVHHLQPQI